MVPVYFFDCIACKHRKDDNGIDCCLAFPNGIPDEIIHGLVKPHKMEQCGNGIKFEDKRPPEFQTYSD